ncbi:uncharacterized protein MYCFIDRAFT_208593 [Pseudocercospora fijiensis CIRAD86]|uniref:Uncharacterized protein n=1 Tax=Pseudocercospora fijiensis (strain CIRAD86) TaxID=383855 RepID=M3A766_PSEFD|nr:uncharacterized protein MYCFIDRAFT_208593 [Pseudocercospora fijiensis CIRAD86]EME80466.1 hypothetical protein MYCFIDRAFT_208593 [Pseudocercospora fijiensis CIRAD86]
MLIDCPAASPILFLCCFFLAASPIQFPCFFLSCGKADPMTMEFDMRAKMAALTAEYVTVTALAAYGFQRWLPKHLRPRTSWQTWRACDQRSRALAE